MAGSAGAIRAGAAFIELLAKDGISGVLNKVTKRMAVFGQATALVGDKVAAAGKRMAMIGVGAGAGLAPALKVFSNFDSALASLRTAANPTAAEMEKIRGSIDDISKATGAGPTKVVESMTELAKAGLPLETILGGAAESALKFSKVSEMGVGEAAKTLTDAMKVFKVDATTAMDTLSRAADASSISVQDVAQSFSMAGAVAGLANQNIQDTANAIAILGQNGVKGSDAGTSLKTMLLRLMAPAEEGAKQIDTLGIKVRDGAGNMKDMRGIIGELQAKLGGLNQEAKDNAMRDIFGSDAIRAGAILVGKGTEGWDEFNKKMGEGLPVSKKFAVLMDTLSGSGEKALAALERLAISVGAALAPAVGKAAAVFADFADSVGAMVKADPALIGNIAKMIGGAIALGGAMMVAGSALSSLVGTIAFLATPVGQATAAIGLLAVAVAGAGVAWARYSADGQKAVADFLPMIMSMKDTALQAFQGIADALKAGDLTLAGKIFWAGMKVEWLKGIDYLSKTWAGFKSFAKDVWAGLPFDLEKAMVSGFHAVERGWLTLVSDLEGGWGSGMARMASMLVDLLGPAAKILATVFGVDVYKEVEKVAKLLDVGVTPEKTAKRLAELKTQTDKVDAKEQEKLDKIDERKNKSVAEQRKSRGPEDTTAGERAAGIATAEGELKGLTDQAAAAAKAKAAAGEAAAPGEGAAGPKKMPMLGGLWDKAAAAVDQSLGGKSPEDLSKLLYAPDVPMEDIHSGIDQAARKVDVQGSFSAVAAGRLSAGTSVENMLEEQSKKQDRTNNLLERIEKNTKEGGVYTTAP